jgi:hypothetical protein
MKKSKLLALREEIDLACDRLARAIGSIDAAREVMDRRYSHMTQRLDMLSQEIRDLRTLVQEGRRPIEYQVIYPRTRREEAKSKR